ncbi:MAG: hypothetical protein HY790_06595 [Deltaproteobacteria bacterium]|nr:hypothetical protein [Deltaproteobacteria bacterium]
MIKKNINFYVICGIVFLGSFFISSYFQVDSLLREISKIPSVGALFVALFQLFRDEAAFEKQRALQADQQYFQIGATSHMANVAFDKHAAFSEEYIAQVNENCQNPYPGRTNS